MHAFVPLSQLSSLPSGSHSLNHSRHWIEADLPKIENPSLTLQHAQDKVNIPTMAGETAWQGEDWLVQSSTTHSCAICTRAPCGGSSFQNFSSAVLSPSTSTSCFILPIHLIPIHPFRVNTSFVFFRKHFPARLHQVSGEPWSCPLRVRLITSLLLQIHCHHFTCFLHQNWAYRK